MQLSILRDPVRRGVRVGDLMIWEETESPACAEVVNLTATDRAGTAVPLPPWIPPSGTIYGDGTITFVLERADCGNGPGRWAITQHGPEADSKVIMSGGSTAAPDGFRAWIVGASTVLAINTPGGGDASASWSVLVDGQEVVPSCSNGAVAEPFPPIRINDGVVWPQLCATQRSSAVEVVVVVSGATSCRFPKLAVEAALPMETDSSDQYLLLGVLNRDMLTERLIFVDCRSGSFIVAPKVDTRVGFDPITLGVLTRS